MQKRRFSRVLAFAIALPMLASGSGPALAATLQQCAVNFSICYATCAGRHPEQDISGRGLCQANCLSTRVSCEVTATDRNVAAPPAADKPKRRVPHQGILQTAPLTTKPPSGTKKPTGGDTAPPGGRLQ